MFGPKKFVILDTRLILPAPFGAGNIASYFIFWLFSWLSEEAEKVTLSVINFTQVEIGHSIDLWTDRKLLLFFSNYERRTIAIFAHIKTNLKIGTKQGLDAIWYLFINAYL